MTFLRPNRYPGKLIAIEGIGGSGKSLQARLLRASFDRAAIVSAAGPSERQFTTAASMSLAEAAELSDRMDREIVPALKAGGVVCVDGYVYSACARAMVRGMSRKWVRNLYSFAVNANLTFYLRLSSETALARMRSFRRTPGFYESGMDLGLSRSAEESFRLFHGRIGAELDDLARELDWRTVDATTSAEEQQEEIRHGAGKLRQ